MGEGIKDRIILILIVLMIIFFVSTVSSCLEVAKLKKTINQEMTVRMESEESALNLSRENADLKQKIAQLNTDLDQEKAAHKVTRDTLNQELLVSQSLREEIEKLTKLKEKLEENLKEALVLPGKK